MRTRIASRPNIKGPLRAEIARSVAMFVGGRTVGHVLMSSCLARTAVATGNYLHLTFSLGETMRNGGFRGVIRVSTLRTV